MLWALTEGVSPIHEYPLEAHPLCENVRAWTAASRLCNSFGLCLGYLFHSHAE